MKSVISWEGFFPCTWNKLIKKSIYKKVSFPTTTYSEDRAIMAQVLFFCNKIAYINKAFYHWCVIPDSASRNKNNLINHLLDDYKSYITIIYFIFENILEYENFTKKIINHVDYLGHKCYDNKKILNLYKESIQRIIDFVKEGENAKVEDEQNSFERNVFELNKKFKKYIPLIELKNIFKKCIPKSIKTYIKTLLRQGHCA